MTTFVDRVVLHPHARATAATAAPRSTGRSSSRSAVRTAATAATAAASCWSSTRSVHTLLDFHFHPHVKAPQRQAGRGRQPRRRQRRRPRAARCPTAPSSSTRDGEVLADLVGAGTTFDVARGGRGGLGNAALAIARPQGPRLRAARRARRGPRRRARAQDRRRRRPGRLPVGRQVVAGLGDLGGPAEDRRLPVHHAGAQPRRGHGRGSQPSPSPTCPG